jgi:type I restriction enzyme S subunit
MAPSLDIDLHPYQETKIGPLPTTWDVVSLGEISDPNAPIRYGVVQIGSDTEDGVPIVPIKHIRRIGYVKLHRAAPQIEGKYKNSRVQENDILLSVKGTIGEVGVVPQGFEGNIAREIARIRTSPRCEVGFLSQQLDAEQTKRRIDTLVVGSTRLEFSIHAVRNFLVALPPLPEQRKIADILSTWDQAIEKTEVLLSSARTQKRALMQQLLTGNRRFPAFEGQPWKEVRLGDVVKIDWGNTSITKKSYVDKGADAYSAAGQDGFVKDAEFSGPGIVLSAIGARCGRCFWADGDWTAIKNTIVIQQKLERCDLGFLYQIVNDTRFWPISGGAQPFIGLKNARSTKLKLPSLDEQRKISKMLATSDKEIETLSADITKLRTEKKALMQQLLTGKRRVVV